MIEKTFSAPKRKDLECLLRAVTAFRPYRWQVALVLLIIVVSSGLALLSSLLIREIFDDAIARHDVGRLMVYSVLMFVMPVAANLLGVLQAYVNTRVAQNVMRDLRDELFAHLQRMSLRFFTASRSGEIQSRVINDIGGVQNVVTNTAANVASNLITVIGSIVAMAYISPFLTGLSLAFLPLFLLIAHRTGRMRRNLNGKKQQHLARLNGFLHEILSLNGVLLIKTFGRQNFARQAFQGQNDEIAKIEVHQQVVGRWGAVGFGIIFAGLPAVIYLIGGWQITENETLLGSGMTAGSLVAITTLQARLFAPAGQILNSQADIQAALAMFERIFDYLDLKPDIIEGPVTLKPAELRGELSFTGVSFSYVSDRGRKTVGSAVHDITFVARPGETVALVGPSGAGKTTIAYLAARLYDPDAGVVKIDGQDLRSISFSSLADVTGFVTQETYLLHASIRENLLWARSDASDADMIAAAKAAAIHDRIMQCSEGYDTVIGERGYKLSGGERQRLAIARAILKNPRILFMDEATSALDDHSERLIQEALEGLRRGRTTIVIAHRLSTIKSADQIIVLNGGFIVECGRHEELLAREGFYAALCTKATAG